MADELELTDAERNLILASRTAAAAKKAETPLTLEDIKPNMPAALKQKIMDRIVSAWSK